jgi:hypothetical protein
MADRQSPRSRVGGKAYVHRNGDVKVDPSEPGCNVLPDGRIALSARLVAALARESAARRPPMTVAPSGKSSPDSKNKVEPPA